MSFSVPVRCSFRYDMPSHTRPLPDLQSPRQIRRFAGMPLQRPAWHVTSYARAIMPRGFFVRVTSAIV